MTNSTLPPEEIFYNCITCKDKKALTIMNITFICPKCPKSYIPDSVEKSTYNPYAGENSNPEYW